MNTKYTSNYPLSQERLSLSLYKSKLVMWARDRCTKYMKLRPCDVINGAPTDLTSRHFLCKVNHKRICDLHPLTLSLGSTSWPLFFWALTLKTRLPSRRWQVYELAFALSSQSVRHCLMTPDTNHYTHYIKQGTTCVSGSPLTWCHIWQNIFCVYFQTSLKACDLKL